MVVSDAHPILRTHAVKIYIFEKDNQHSSLFILILDTHHPGMVLKGLDEGQHYKLQVNYSCSRCALATMGYRFYTGYLPIGGTCIVDPVQGQYYIFRTYGTEVYLK